jgi:hypothetical protein
MVRKEQRLGAIQNWVSRNEEWRQLHDEELHLYFSPIVIQVINKIKRQEISRHMVRKEVHTAFWWWKT